MNWYFKKPFLLLYDSCDSKLTSKSGPRGLQEISCQNVFPGQNSGDVDAVTESTSDERTCLVFAPSKSQSTDPDTAVHTRYLHVWW